MTPVEIMKKILIVTFAFLPASLFAEKITFPNSEGIQLVGEFTKPQNPHNYTIILLHGLGSTKEEWDSFYKLLASNGYGVFAYDARGHGESKKKSSGESVDYQTFYGRGLQSEWGKMIGDLGAAVECLRKNFKLDPRTIAI